MSERNSPFADRAMVKSYASDVPRKVPGLHDLHRMAMLLIAEEAPKAASILVIGAGGGMETAALAQAQPGWRFTGVDPSPAMLDLARQAVIAFAERINLIAGAIDQAPCGPFDGATCLLTLHHINRNERLHTLQQIHRRLRPGARLVIANHSAVGPHQDQWIMRSVAFAGRDGPDWQKAQSTGQMMAQRLHLLTPSQEEDILREAGFIDVALFYAAFSFRGWIATATKSGK